MKPILYKSDETNFNTLGLGILSETITCEVTEERNGLLELYLEYPVAGLHYAEIEDLCLIKAKPNSVDDLHLFRIYERQFDMASQVVSVYATSISNDLGGNLVQNVVATGVSPQTALDQMKAGLVEPTNFMFYSDINTTNNVDWKMRNPLNCIAGEEGSLLDVFGGEIKRGNSFIWFYARRGRDNVTTVRHGKNLTGLEVEYSTKGLVTKILPYFTQTPEGSETEETITGDLVVSQYAGNYPVSSVLPVDYSSDERVTDLASLNSVAASYFTENTGVDRPSLTMQVELDDLSDSSEYAQFKDLENIELCDTITVYAQRFGVNVTAKVTKLVYDTLREKNKSLDVGSIRTSFYDAVKGGYKDLVKDVEVTLTNTIEKAANGKNRVFRGTDEPLTGMVKNDVWYKPVGAGEIEMYVFDGAYWQKEAYSADSLGGTVNFANINAINLNLNTLTTASITGANMWLNLITGEMQFTNPTTGDVLVLNQGEIFFQNGDNTRHLRYSPQGLIMEPGAGNTGTALNTGFILVGPDGSHKYIDFRNTDLETTQRLVGINETIRTHTKGRFEIRKNVAFNGTDAYNGVRAIGYFIGDGTEGLWYGGDGVAVVEGYNMIDFRIRGVGVMQIYENGIECWGEMYMNGHTIWDESDLTLKTKILPTAIDAIAETKKQKVIEFEWDKSNPHNEGKPEGTQFGLSAQHSGILQLTPEETGKGYMGVNLIKEIHLATLTNQKLIKRLEALEARVAALEN